MPESADQRVARVEEDYDYSLTELADSQERISEWVRVNIHAARGCIGCDICTMRAMLDITADVLRALKEGETHA